MNCSSRFVGRGLELGDKQMGKSGINRMKNGYAYLTPWHLGLYPHLCSLARQTISGTALVLILSTIYGLQVLSLSSL